MNSNRVLVGKANYVGALLSKLDLLIRFLLDLDRVMYRELALPLIGTGLRTRDCFCTAAAALALRKSRILSGAAGARWGFSTVGSVKLSGDLLKHVWPADAYLYHNLADLSESSFPSTSAWPGTQNKNIRLDRPSSFSLLRVS